MPEIIGDTCQDPDGQQEQRVALRIIRWAVGLE